MRSHATRRSSSRCTLLALASLLLLFSVSCGDGDGEGDRATVEDFLEVMANFHDDVVMVDGFFEISVVAANASPSVTFASRNWANKACDSSDGIATPGSFTGSTVGEGSFGFTVTYDECEDIRPSIVSRSIDSGFLRWTGNGSAGSAGSASGAVNGTLNVAFLNPFLLTLPNLPSSCDVSGTFSFDGSGETVTADYDCGVYEIRCNESSFCFLR